MSRFGKRRGYLLRMGSDGKAVKGRGASEQVANRFLKRSYGVLHWEGIDEPIDEAGQPTRYLVEHPRTILNKVDPPDLSFPWSMNVYQGCEHGCSYCYARPTHEYWGYSAGLDFERVIIVKRNAPELLEKALRHPKWAGEPIMMSGATDPYQPVEREEQLTRRCLEVFAKFRHPVSIITKNALVLRDLDLLAALAADGLAQVAISLTTLDEDLRRVLEPRTSTGANRVKAIAALTEAGVPVHVMVAPIIPGLNDREVPALLKAAAEAGALSAGYTVLRTNGAVEPIFRSWLEQHFPDRAAKVIAQTSALHGGRMNDSVSGRRMKGEGPYAESIKRVFTVFRRRYFGDRVLPALDRTKFTRPPEGQLDLFT
jgi:DNA repair photolyase